MHTRSSAASPPRSTDKPCLKEDESTKKQLGILCIVQMGNNIQIAFDDESKFKKNWPSIEKSFSQDPLYSEIQKQWQELSDEISLSGSSQNSPRSDDEDTLAKLREQDAPSPTSSQELTDEPQNFQLSTSCNTNDGTSPSLIANLLSCVFGGG
ncbi:hypothetical protein N9Y17_05015 [Gammaproteobacteria bacterium]|nr:hypothetical protein [Gammaproteobacteria bacterium]